MGLSQQLAQKIAAAKLSGSGNKIREGRYILEVHRVFCEPKYKGNFFIAEMSVVESEAVSSSVEPNKPGSTCSVAFNLDAKGPAGEAAMGNTKQFVLALCGLSVDADMDEFIAKLKWVTDDANPSRGMYIGCETVRKRIVNGPNAGTEGVFPKFENVPQSADDVKQRRATLDAGAAKKLAA